MTPPLTNRPKQRLNAATLTGLLDLDLPGAYWVLPRHGSTAHGLVPSIDDVRTWAEVISGGVTDVERHGNGTGSFRASGTGAYERIEAWCPLTAEQLAELDQTATGGAL